MAKGVNAPVAPLMHPSHCYHPTDYVHTYIYIHIYIIYI